MASALPDIPPAGLDLLVTSGDDPDWLPAAARDTLAAVRDAIGTGTAALQLDEAGRRSQDVRRMAKAVLDDTSPPPTR